MCSSIKQKKLKKFTRQKNMKNCTKISMARNIIWMTMKS